MGDHGYHEPFLKTLVSLVIALQSVDHYRGGNLGIVNVPVGWLDVRSPVVGSFPVIAVGGQRVGSLDVTLELHYTSDSLASFELQERLAAAQDASQDAAGRSSDYTLNQDAGLHEPEQHQEVVPGIEFEEVLDQLDLFEVLHSKLYRWVPSGVVGFQIPVPEAHPRLPSTVATANALQHTSKTNGQQAYMGPPQPNREAGGVGDAAPGRHGRLAWGCMCTDLVQQDENSVAMWQVQHHGTTSAVSGDTADVHAYEQHCHRCLASMQGL
jgi:hypothetical protein